ncbi:PhoX family protein [Rufibacter latericius]|uniref:Phosphatase n=1 Tax=Rufibacter latericius TaxID=2487040 RepID=A0A3M9MUI4_9BACT|nr:hypothetical protein [Rufibacter latericius]RNI29176.1 hypothetical protein EFB08_07055 [Rufibacter latericius]
MKPFRTRNLTLTLGLTAVTLLGACREDDSAEDTTPISTDLEIKSQSVTPSLVKMLSGFENIKINPLISSEDKLEGSPSFIYGAQPDGSGMLKDPNGDGFVMITNHEILQSVSRVYLDKNLKPTKGEYIVDGAGGRWRLCSATLATPEEHGFGPTFLTAGESGIESMIHSINPFGLTSDKNNPSRVLPALGKCSAENAVPLPKAAYANKTAIFIGEDESNPANSMGQVNLYLSNSTGDLQGGKLYMLRRTNKNAVETDMQVNTAYDVEFVEYSNVVASTGAQLAAQTVEQGAIQFARVEDLDYGKGSPAANRTLYFTSTGVSQADKLTPVTGLTMWGRVYKLELDANNPLAGKLTPLIDGEVDPGNSIVNPDNICVTENFVYIQEDGDSYYKNNKHDGRIWQYSIATKQIKPMLEMDHRRSDAAFNTKFNPGNDTRLSSWEYGAMYDISDLVGVPGTFVVNIHPHTWTSDAFLPGGKGADGSGVVNNKEGGQTVILTGVAR